MVTIRKVAPRSPSIASIAAWSGHSDSARSCIDRASGRARLSYRQAEDLFKAAAGGATPHQLRHSALTHDAEFGASTPMLMAKSGHTR
jgi:integrase